MQLPKAVARWNPKNGTVAFLMILTDEYVIGLTYHCDFSRLFTSEKYSDCNNSSVKETKRTENFSILVHRTVGNKIILY